MSYNYLIDSSAWIEYFFGTEKGVKIKPLIEREEIATSTVAIAEIADKLEREKHAFSVMLQFIKSRATVIPVSVEIALRAAKLKNQIRGKRDKFGISDGIHLATALSLGAVLLTTDSDFSGVENVMLV